MKKNNHNVKKNRQKRQLKPYKTPIIESETLSNREALTICNPPGKDVVPIPCTFIGS